ncbi:class D sortase [Aquibacillus rhizosphaerae]|uniref:Class D sortase n=1 Tax=Aquibacillus rhizosphaerae TaxID=3051431 RepID=A0ABT7L575_9BACI|nr:class D sortase [Aquibacillus sp. LR5S19]MDL4840544.1 class D sortase [Aquibacillus sp. LR5S19]
MRKRKKKKRSVKYFILLFLCFTVIGTGLWFTSTNTYKFLKGYLLFKTEYANEPIAEVAVDSEVSSARENDNDKTLYPTRPEKGEEMGVLRIPKIDAELPIFHGSDEDELAKGVGHFADSVLPGEADNAVLSGHRDTVFRELGEVGKNDLLIVTTSAGEFTYKVRKVRIVDADDRTVIVPKPRATLTVTTCYPFNFIGDAPERYVLVADLQKEELVD